MYFSHEVQECIDIFRKSKGILIISHKNPDGDTLGASAALQTFLSTFHQPKVISYCSDSADISLLSPNLNFIFGENINLSNIDCIVCVDTPALHMIGNNSIVNLIISKSFPIINIDHHPDNEIYGTCNIIDSTASSTTNMLFKIFQSLSYNIPTSAATALLMGTYTDTGSFMHANTNEESYKIAGQLITYGADYQSIIQHHFRYFPPNRLKLWGEIFRKIYLNKRHIVSSVVTQEDLDRTKTDTQDLTGAVEYLNMIPNTEFAILLTEDKKNQQVKASLRTRNDKVDVSSIAHRYGGGGHTRASGFKVSGVIEEERRWTITNQSGINPIEEL